MEESLVYRGHHIMAKTIEHVYGKWCWTYTIDGQTTYSAPGSFHIGPQQALGAAIVIGKARIDRSIQNGQSEDNQSF